LQVLLKEWFPWGYCKLSGLSKQYISQFNLNAFNVCCTQVHKTKYSMNMQYPILGNPKIVWAPYHIFWNLEKYCVALTKLWRNVIPSLSYTVTP
jgi:hypothetical protein